MMGLTGFGEAVVWLAVKALVFLVLFISKESPTFSSSQEAKAILVKKKNENQHSTAFCVFMTNRCKARFCFQRENAQKGNSVIDIGVYYGANLIFTIESKLLPTPPGTKKQPRFEHEYVSGKGAGIERFKNEKHGYDNEDNPLLENAMIGFVLENGIDFWLAKINQWIVDAKWGEGETIQKSFFSGLEIFKSRHQRNDNSYFILYHFLINFNRNTDEQA